MNLTTSKKTLMANLMQNWILLAICIIYYRVSEIKGAEKIVYMLLIYSCLLISILVEFYHYEDYILKNKA